MAIPLLAYWGVAILFAGGATIAARNLQQEIEIGRIDLDDLLDRSRNSDPEPEPEEDWRPPGGGSVLAREALKQLVETQTRARRRCQDEPERGCDDCPPLVDGKATNPWHDFDGGPVRKPSPRARGSLYQHSVAPWFGFTATESGGQLRIQVEEWEWLRGRDGSWDALDFAACKLLECKLGYRDFLDEDRIGDNDAYLFPNPQKPFLGTLQNAFVSQLQAQYAAVLTTDGRATLKWIFSDSEVNWQFVAMTSDMGLYDVQNEHRPFEMSPNGTLFVREQYADGELDYGYWEDN